jgi:peptide/nickel transport system ATP-binding protein
MLRISDPILSLRNLTVRFDASDPWLARTILRRPRRIVHAVEDVSLSIERGSTYALAGESGCGKSTIARTIAGIERPTSGSIVFMGVDLAQPGRRRGMLPYRRHLQMIFQDPHASLNPRWRVGGTVAEPIRTHGLLPRRQIPSRVAELLSLTGLSPEDARKYPHQFSGGQRQRISIARALASNPTFLICDEPTSALDVSVQAQILNLMRSLQQRHGLTYLFISHNLAVIAHMADRLGVMYLGRLVEEGDTSAILSSPKHPYTRILLDTVSRPDQHRPQQTMPKGEVPSPFAPPSGCSFHPRCPLAVNRCVVERPEIRVVDGVRVACHRADDPAASTRQATITELVEDGSRTK